MAQVIETVTTPVVIEVKAPVVQLPNEVALTIAQRLGSEHPLLKVAKCESGFRQFNKDGSVLRGRQNSLDVGAFQINENYHLKASKSLGYDIHTLEGNIDYAEHLYKTQGLKPWNWSKHCWGQ